jgi:hypothetical protein
VPVTIETHPAPTVDARVVGLSTATSATNVSAYNHGIMGYRTPNIDRIAKEGALFTDAYAQQSCTAGRASFILASTRSGPGC